LQPELKLKVVTFGKASIELTLQERCSRTNLWMKQDSVICWEDETHIAVATRRNHNKFKKNKRYRGIVRTIRVFTDHGKSLNK